MKNNSMKVSLREYARIRGVRLNAVQTAITSGRIHKTPDGKIDVDEANREWFMNTDPAKSRKAIHCLRLSRNYPSADGRIFQPFSRPKQRIFIIGRCWPKQNSKW